jgi:SAM-dependent methyltransferase
VEREALLRRVADYYSAKVLANGPTPRGADWNSEESQHLRFSRLLLLCNEPGSFSLNDYGCGYGALALYLAGRGMACDYRGLDVSDVMVAQARLALAGLPRCTVSTDPAALAVADYTVASGIFNVRLDADRDEWEAHARETLARMAAVSRRGFAFNCLTTHADPDRMRRDLYYADPTAWFDHCRRTFSPRVALLHDYPLWEFTILVRTA